MGDQSRSGNFNRNYNPRDLGVPERSASTKNLILVRRWSPRPERGGGRNNQSRTGWSLREVLKKGSCRFPCTFPGLSTNPGPSRTQTVLYAGARGQGVSQALFEILIETELSPDMRGDY